MGSLAAVGGGPVPVSAVHRLVDTGDSGREESLAARGLSTSTRLATGGSGPHHFHFCTSNKRTRTRTTACFLSSAFCHFLLCKYLVPKLHLALLTTCQWPCPPSGLHTEGMRRPQSSARHSARGVTLVSPLSVSLSYQSLMRPPHGDKSWRLFRYVLLHVEWESG